MVVKRARRTGVIFIRNGFDSPKFLVGREPGRTALGWLSAGAALRRDSNVETPTNRGVEPLLQQGVRVGAHMEKGCYHWETYDVNDGFRECLFH